MTSGCAFNSNAPALACPKAARPRHDQISNVWIRNAGNAPAQGTRASANTSGPDSTLARRPLVKLRSPPRGAAPNEENLFLLPDRTLASEPAKENDPTVDLMSRRHPLSSTRTFEKALMTCRLSRSRQLQKAKLLLLGDLASLLRSLLHCALRLLRLLCLLSFLGHVALRCVRWLNRCMQSGIECTLIPNTPTQRKKQRLA